MSNPNNCETCDYRHMKGPDDNPGQHCYMFQDTPTEVCMQHTTRSRSFGECAYAAAVRAGYKGNRNDWERDLRSNFANTKMAALVQLFT